MAGNIIEECCQVVCTLCLRAETKDGPIGRATRVGESWVHEVSYVSGGNLVMFLRPCAAELIREHFHGREVNHQLVQEAMIAA